MITQEEAVDTLYETLVTDEYKTASSWVATKNFKLTDMYLMGDKPFILDRTLDPK
jgi:hypothetical protein